MPFIYSLHTYSEAMCVKRCFFENHDEREDPNDDCSRSLKLLRDVGFEGKEEAFESDRRA